MRETRNAQLSIFDNYSTHPLGQRLCAVSDLLDSNPCLLELVERDFPRDNIAQTGANGLSIESIFRCLLLKQMLQVSYSCIDLPSCAARAASSSRTAFGTSRIVIWTPM